MTAILPERRIARDAPKPAADETPRRSGLTRGFLNNPWNEAPLMESPAPISKAVNILGSRMLNITVLTVSGHVCWMGQILTTRAFKTTGGEMKYRPKNKEINAITTGKRMRKRVVFLRLLFI